MLPTENKGRDFSPLPFLRAFSLDNLYFRYFLFEMYVTLFKS